MADSRLAWSDWRHRWPNADHSRFVDAAGIRWHVQVAGNGPVALLLHGAGGATHSWDAMLPALARRWTVVAPDLPGHAFSSTPAAVDRLSLEGMAADLATLLATLGLSPSLVVGHSAGAALLLRLVIDGAISPHAVVGLNAALAAPPAAADATLGPAVRALARAPVVASALSMIAGVGPIADALLQSTGTTLPADQRRRYAALAGSPAHVHAVLTMFANWNVAALRRALPTVTVPVTLAVAPDDPWVPPAETAAVAATMPTARCVALPAAGHLAHEREPAAAIEVVTRAASEAATPARP
jgi:magnesium chelatase accessory protein